MKVLFAMILFICVIPVTVFSSPYVETGALSIESMVHRGILQRYRLKLMNYSDSTNPLARLGGSPTVIDLYLDRRGRLRKCGIFVRTPAAFAYYQCVFDIYGNLQLLRSNITPPIENKNALTALVRRGRIVRHSSNWKALRFLQADSDERIPGFIKVPLSFRTGYDPQFPLRAGAMLRYRKMFRYLGRFRYRPARVGDRVLVRKSHVPMYSGPGRGKLIRQCGLFYDLADLAYDRHYSKLLLIGQKGAWFHVRNLGRYPNGFGWIRKDAFYPVEERIDKEKIR